MLRLLYCTSFLLVPCLSMATGPDWWDTHQVIDSQTPADDYAVVNQGQVKHIATAAADYLDNVLAPIGGAGPIIDTLVHSWTPPPSGTDDYLAINLGQLKYVAQPFYGRLIGIGFSPEYPWEASGAGSPDDYALANIGQVKHLFSFDLDAFDTSSVNIMGDGLLDEWKVANGLNPFTTDSDGDGIWDIIALKLGWDPLENQPPGPDSGDTTPPAITLLSPGSAVLIP